MVIRGVGRCGGHGYRRGNKSDSRSCEEIRLFYWVGEIEGPGNSVPRTVQRSTEMGVADDKNKRINRKKCRSSK